MMDKATTTTTTTTRLLTFGIIGISISIFVFVPIFALGSVSVVAYVPYYGGINPWPGLGTGASAGGGWPLIHRPPMVIGLPGMPLGSPVMHQLSQVQGEPSE